MCIRDSPALGDPADGPRQRRRQDRAGALLEEFNRAMFGDCLLYTSDAADERSSVDLGGRRIIKTKKLVATKPQVV